MTLGNVTVLMTLRLTLTARNRALAMISMALESMNPRNAKLYSTARLFDG